MSPERRRLRTRGVLASLGPHYDHHPNHVEAERAADNGADDRHGGRADKTADDRDQRASCTAEHVNPMMDEVLSECVHLGTPFSLRLVQLRSHYADCASGAARTTATAYYGGAS
jgi:hypothetical protein